MAGFAALFLRHWLGKGTDFTFLRKFKVWVEIRGPLQQGLGRSNASLGLIRGREALFMKEDFIQNILESTVWKLSPFLWIEIKLMLADAVLCYSGEKRLYGDGKVIVSLWQPWNIR